MRITPVLLVLGLAACGPATISEDRFRDWSASPEASNLASYRQYLEKQGVGDVIPMQALLRSSRRWRECRGSEFALPPQAEWPHIVPTLRMLQSMQIAGLVDGSLAASGYRDAEVNRCAGGSARSRHLLNNAVDLDLPVSPDNVRRLCEYWQLQGPALRMGLGFYTETRIHLDTSGFRTWGTDHTRQTSLCATLHSDRK